MGNHGHQKRRLEATGQMTSAVSGEQRAPANTCEPKCHVQKRTSWKPTWLSCAQRTGHGSGWWEGGPRRPAGRIPREQGLIKGLSCRNGEPRTPGWAGTVTTTCLESIHPLRPRVWPSETCPFWGSSNSPLALPCRPGLLSCLSACAHPTIKASPCLTFVY